MATYFRTDGWVKTALGAAIPGAQIYVCNQPANIPSNLNIAPPSPLATIFSDVNGLVPIAQPIITDGFGHYDFYTSPGAYTIIVAYGGVVQQVYPDQSVGAVSATTNGGSTGGTALVLQTNGANTTNQLLANFKGSGGTTVSSDAVGGITISSVTAAFSTAGFGYFWSFAGVNEAGGQPVSSPNLTQGSNGQAASGNRVICFQLTLKVAYTVRSVSMFVAGQDGGGNTATCAIYDATGTTKLLDAGTGAFNTSNVATMQTVTLGTPVVLQPGVYWFACSATTGTPGTSVGASLTAGAAGYNSFFNANSVRAGNSANAMSGGAMPSSLGVITAFPTGTFSYPGFFFQV